MLRRIGFIMMTFLSFVCCDLSFAQSEVYYTKGNIEIIAYKQVSSNKLTNVVSAIDSISFLLNKYGLTLDHKAYAVVTENQQDYANAIEQYTGSNAQEALQKAETSGGLSLSGKSTVILRGSSSLEKYPVESYDALPHEMFHQVQYSYGVNTTNVPAWFLEGTAEFFRYLAFDYAGFQTEKLNAQDAFARLFFSCYFKRKPLVPLSSLVSYQDWNKALTKEVEEGESSSSYLFKDFYDAIYPYATLSIIRLTNGDFSKVSRILKDMQSGQSFDSAFTEVFNISEQQFEKNMTNSLSEEIEKKSKELSGHSVTSGPGLPKRQSGPLGMGWQPCPDGLRILAVFPDSPAKEANIDIGDIITAIDGHVTQGITAQKVLELTDGQPGTSMTLDVLRGTQKLQFIIKRPPPIK